MHAKSLLIFTTLALSAYAAPTGPVVVSGSNQGASGNGGLVGAGVNAVANAAVTGVKAVVANNNIGNDVANNANVKVLSPRGVPTVISGASQGASGNGGLVGAGVNAVANAAATVVDADVECNNILNDVGNNADVKVLSPRQIVGSSAAQGAQGNGGLVGAGVNAIVNAAAKVADVKVIDNNIGNDVLNNLDVKVLSPRQIVGSSANQGAQGNGGLVGAGVNAIVNAAVKGVDATVVDNNIANGVLNNLNVDVLRRQIVGSDANQGAGATGAIAAAANAAVNAAVKGVDATVIGNNIANDVLNNPDIRVLSPRQIVGSSANQGAGATGAVAAAANAVANAAVKGVDATVTYNNIANDVANNANVKVGRRTVISYPYQAAGAVGGVAGAAANVAAAVDAVVADVDVKNNNILNNVGNNACVRVLSNGQCDNGSGSGSGSGSGNGGSGSGNGGSGY